MHYIDMFFLQWITLVAHQLGVYFVTSTPNFRPHAAVKGKQRKN